MDNLMDFFNHLTKTDMQEVGMDTCHYLQIIGSVVAHKPEKILEVGIGTALLTVGLVMGVRYNRCGTITCVDNWFDWGGLEPPGISQLRDAGVNVVAPLSEKEFLDSCPTDEYDFVVSDGDHNNCGLWVDQYFRITKPGGMIYFHDSNNTEMFPSMRLVERRVKELGLPHVHFTRNSRPDERCERGLLFVINRKDAV